MAQRQPPQGYPSGAKAKEEEAPQANDKAQQTNGEDDTETDRGISARLTFGRSKPWSHEQYPGPGFAPPRVSHNRANRHDYPAPHSHGSHSYEQRVEYEKPCHGSHSSYQQRVEYEVSDEEEGYEGGYGHQPNPYNRKPHQYYRQETVVEQPPPPRRRPQGNYYVRDEYVEY